MDKNHPELKIGEMWLTNGYDKLYHHIEYETKRKGNIAFDKYGEIIEGIYPIFIERREFIKVQNDYKRNGF